MPDIRQFTLSKDVNWVNATTWPEDGGCNVLCLTDRQLSIVRQMVWPRCLFDQSFAVPIYPGHFRYPDSDLYAEYVDAVESLIDKLGEGSTVDCQAMLDQLEAIAGSVARGTPISVVYQKTDMPAGTSSQTIYQCPDSGVHLKVHALCFASIGTATSVKVGIDCGDGVAYIYEVRPPTSGQYYTFVAPMELTAGDILILRVIGATLNDDLYGWVHGVVYDVPVIE